MSRQGLAQARAAARKIVRDSVDYDAAQARTAISVLERALSDALDAVDRIDREAPRRTYDRALRPHSAVDHGAIDRHIETLARTLRVVPPDSGILP